MNASLVVLAAGMGSRYGGSKQTAGVGPADEWLLDYAIFDGLHAGFRDIVLVIKPGADDDFAAVQERWGGRVKIRLVEQRPGDLPSWFSPPADRVKPWGTGHAVLAVRDAVTSPFAVINADDYYGREAYELAFTATRRAREAGDATIVGMRLDGTLSEHGAVTRAIVEHRDGIVTRVTEVGGVARTASGFTPSNLTGAESVSMNFWVFPTRIFELFQREFDGFLREQGQDIKAEFLLPTVVNTLISRGELRVHLDQAPGPWLGLTHASDRERVASGLRAMAERGHYPVPLWR